MAEENVEFNEEETDEDVSFAKDDDIITSEDDDEDSIQTMSLI